MQTTQQNLFEVFSWYPGELDIFRKREPLTVSQWAERHRVIRMGARPGPWKNSVTPYLTEIMDTWALPWVQKVAVCAAAQVGKTEAMYNCLGFAIDRHPGPAMVIMPDQEMTRRVSKDRIKPMIENSRVLSELLSPDPDDLSKTRIKFRSGMTVNLSWASSPSLLASMPIEYLFFDEVDKYPEFSGKESDPISLGEARTSTYQWTKKIFMVSTPTTENKFIWPAMMTEAQEVRHYHVPCPECGKFQTLQFEQIKHPEDVDYKRIRRKYLARYECLHCQAQWTDADRNIAVRAGHWEAVKPVKHPQSVGFHLPVYYSPFVSLSEVAATYLEAEENAKIGDKAKLMHFYNSLKAEPYTDVQVERKEDSILALRDDRPRGLVPKNVSCLTIAVDTQKRGFYYEIRAWGWGLELESWQIREGFVDSFDALQKISFDDEYSDASGKSYRIMFGVIDSGGTATDYGASRTAEVYDFCRRVKFMVPIKGQQRKNQPFGFTKIDTYPGTTKLIPGGLKLYSVHVTYFKNTLARKLEIAPTDPGAWHLHSETTEQYAKQMCTEFQNDKGLWECPRGRQNHFWDCGVYNLAAAEILGIRFWKKKAAESTPRTQKERRTRKQKQPKKERKW